MELDEALNEWYQDVVRTMTLTPDEQAEITKAGADVIAPELARVTPESNRNSKHLKDSIVTQAKDIDGQKNGTSVVGYTEDKGYIARFMNDGTKFYPNRKGSGKSHIGFYNRFLTNPTVKNKMLTAEANKLKEIINRKGGD
ncbi:HK97 gp10 family phage protein [Ligilactobacillus sp. LYQ135]